MTLIYISGPYTNGDTVLNVRKAIEVGDAILSMGHIPFVPHLTHFWHFISPKSWEKWLEIDKAILPKCDAVYRIAGESKGADAEVELGLSLGMTIYYSLQEVPFRR